MSGLIFFFLFVDLGSGVVGFLVGIYFMICVGVKDLYLWWWRDCRVLVCFCTINGS